MQNCIRLNLGGALRVAGAVVGYLWELTFRNNSVSDPGSSGGAVHQGATATLLIERSTFISNRAGSPPFTPPRRYQRLWGWPLDQWLNYNEKHKLFDEHCQLRRLTHRTWRSGVQHRRNYSHRFRVVLLEHGR